jgi:ubiquinone/menaquinone biosynthesis C-methylase UbiE
MKVLDVACGTGNAAIPAARARAQVTGVHFVTKFLQQAQLKAEAERLDIEWREGDAENLPFDEGRFDRVLSTFAICSRHAINGPPKRWRECVAGEAR